MGAIVILLLLIMLGCEIWQNVNLTRELSRQQSMLDKLAIRLDMPNDQLDYVLKEDKQCNE